MERTLEWLATFSLYFIFIQIVPITPFLLFYTIIFHKTARYFAIAYSLFIIYEYYFVVQRGGRKSNWWRNSYYFKLIGQYFGFKLVKTHELDPKKNYIFAGHPHGVLCSGAMAFYSNCANVDAIFPHHKINPLSTAYVTCAPFLREMIVGTGMVLASKESAKYILTKCGPGRAIHIAAGGAPEAKLADYNKHRILVSKYRGFCRLALECGSPIVPVYMFGEVNTYKREKLKDGLITRIRLLIVKITEITTTGSMVISEGFKFLFPLVLPMPLRTKNVIVTGKPIEVERIENPTKEQVNALHEKFVKEMVKLFNNEKKKYLEDPNQELEIH